MVQNLDYKFSMPYSSWETLQKIIRAYNAASGDEKPTVRDIANLAGIQRPLVSANNNFLRELGLLQAEVNKLTPLGSRLATGIELDNESMVTEALAESVQSSPGLGQLMNTLRARGTMTVDAFKGHVITMAQLTASSPTLNYVKTIIDYIEAAEVLRIDGDNVIFTGHGFSGYSAGSKEGEKLTLSPQPPPPLPPEDIPIPLGLNRRAHLQLPEQWTSKELPKLLKMIELILGDETEVSRT